ncbi:hypothetical protein [Streptomyces melanogenes]|uniref:Uncharacterized protein n=1 Tax=Streptomyces melanogenes TaxID=67326 RepID=A0ABZ1XN69_9ACTN|nr:hypothetical protein [Streptomyces melanogenes]
MRLPARVSRVSRVSRVDRPDRVDRLDPSRLLLSSRRADVLPPRHRSTLDPYPVAVPRTTS